MQPTLRLCLAVVVLANPIAAQRPVGESTVQLLDRGIARMGGDSLLRSVASIRLEVLTQWRRTMFQSSPLSDLPSYERNVELRDYSRKAWRNSRYFSPIAPSPGVTDVVVDTIAIRAFPVQGSDSLRWGPLNLAYVDERRELFDFAPERLLLGLRADPAIRALTDTVIDGLPHARIAATVGHWPATVYVNRNDALPRLIRFRADETADFGLAPWGEHEVEFWYSGWQLVRPGVLLPMQRDVRRVGETYKRMTIMQAVVNAPAPPDSFAISDSLTAAYLATEHRPMWQVPLEGSARLEDNDIVSFPPFSGSPGAIRIGGRWLVLESGQATGAMELISDWLQRHGGGAPIHGAIAANIYTSNGGAAWFATNRLPVYAAPGAVPTLRTILGTTSGVLPITRAQWVPVGTDSLWMEPFSAPDMPHTMAIYSPTLRWVYIFYGQAPGQRPEAAALIERLRARGLAVEWLGSARGIRTKLEP